jgi:RNA polymerase sigma-70 factor (sigma-E family)
MDFLSSSVSRRDFERFVVDSTPRLLRIGYLLTWNVQEAEDLVQETYLRTAKRWHAIHQMEFPFAYVRQILVNLALRGAKKRARNTAELELFDSHLVETTADDRFEGGILIIDTRSEIDSMLGALSRRQRAVIVLRYFEELSENEIAELLGWPTGTVKSTTARAMEYLRQATVASERSLSHEHQHNPQSKGVTHVKPH